MSALQPITFEPIKLPRDQEVRPSPHARRDSKHMFMGLGAIYHADGTLDRMVGDEWTLNALHDAGELYMLQRAFSAQALSTFYISLINDPSLGDTDGTMAAVTESKTPASGGYDRKNPTTITSDGLISGDYRFSTSEVTFGPITTATLTATAVGLTEQLTSTAGLLYATQALAGSTNILVTQFYKSILRTSAS